jgi:hypothetical protein
MSAGLFANISKDATVEAVREAIIATLKPINTPDPEIIPDNSPVLLLTANPNRLYAQVIPYQMSGGVLWVAWDSGNASVGHTDRVLEGQYWYQYTKQPISVFFEPVNIGDNCRVAFLEAGVEQ